MQVHLVFLYINYFGDKNLTFLDAQSLSSLMLIRNVLFIASPYKPYFSYILIVLVDKTLSFLMHSPFQVWWSIPRWCGNQWTAIFQNGIERYHTVLSNLVCFWELKLGNHALIGFGYLTIATCKSCWPLYWKENMHNYFSVAYFTNLFWAVSRYCTKTSCVILVSWACKLSALSSAIAWSLDEVEVALNEVKILCILAP